MRGDPLGEGALDLDVHGIPAYGAEPPHKHFDVRFAFVAGTLDVSVSDEVAGGKWVPFEALSECETDLSVVRAAAKLRALGLQF